MKHGKDLKRIYIQLLVCGLKCPALIIFIDPNVLQVQCLVGGPPCQGFSMLNAHKETEKSKINNSMIATFISYVDHYRPEFVVLENVK